MAGANSIFYGCKLLTTTNPTEDKDHQLFRKLGLNPERLAVSMGDNQQEEALMQLLPIKTQNNFITRTVMSWQTYLDEQLNARRNTPLWRNAKVIKQADGRFFDHHFR